MNQDLTLAVVVTDDNTAVPTDAIPKSVTDVILINVTKSPIQSDRVIDGTIGANIKVVDIDSQFDAIVNDFKHEYISFVDGIPTSVAGSLLTAQARSSLSPWTIIVDRFKSTSTEYGHPFNVLCRAAAVREVLIDRKPHYGWICTDDVPVVKIYESVLSKENIEILSDSTTSRLLLVNFVLIFLCGLLSIGLELIKSMITTVINMLWSRPAEAADEHVAVLFSRSRNWHQYNWRKDRYYHRLPEAIEEYTDMTSLYAVQIQNDAILRTFYYLIRKRLTGESIYLPQSQLGLSDFVEIGRTYVDWSRRLYEAVRALDATRQVHGVNVMPIVRTELLAAVSSFPFSISLYKGMYACFDNTGAEIVTTTHFESTSGRTVVCAARDQTQSTPTVGVQHGPITDGKLQYLLDDNAENYIYPYPDCIAVDGEVSARVLVSGGYPAGRIQVTGGVRYDPLFESIQKQEDPSGKTDSGDQSIVVFFGLSDFQSMAEIVVPVLSELTHNVVLKPHPSVHAETTAVIESLGENYDLTDYEIVEVDARDLITQSTLVIASYSSTAIEALAFGKPLICVPPKNRLDPTPFNDELVPKVQTEAELRQQIDSKLNFPDRDLNEFLDMFFYTRDGSAAENLSHVCARLAKQN